MNQGRIVVLGMASKMPVAGVVWQTLHYIVGLRRLGYDVYYVEEHGRTPAMLMRSKDDDGTARAVAFLNSWLERFEFDDHWAFRALHKDGSCFGLSEIRLKEVFGSADLI